MTKPRSVRTVWPKYSPWQERRAKLQLDRIERWLLEHQAPHELRIRELLHRQVDAWR